MKPFDLHAFPFEKSLPKELFPTAWAVPLEKPLKTGEKRATLVIGVPKEPVHSENRVALTPEAVAVLVHNGHEVYVENGAGDGARFNNKAYADAGAVICYSLADLYNKAQFIVKISPLSKEELELLKNNQVLLSAVNLGSLNPDYLKVLIRKNITAIGFEFYQNNLGYSPLIQTISEIAGVLSIQIAAELLTTTAGGKGILLGGIPGVPPANVCIIGAGTVGLNAARTAIGMGAIVKVIDNDIVRLRKLEQSLGMPVHTAVALTRYVEDAVRSSDVVIGAAYEPGKRAPVVVSEEMVTQMKPGSVVLDVSIDQGGCIETSRMTSLDHPTFIYEDIIHYCVPNLTSRVSRTASSGISNVLVSLLMEIGDYGGVDYLMQANEGFKKGVYVYRKYLTKQSMASMFGMDFMDINLLVATNI